MPRQKEDKDAALASRPPKRREDDETEDELDVIQNDADVDEFFEENDSNPGDRRRDPLRKP